MDATVMSPRLCDFCHSIGTCKVVHIIGTRMNLFKCNSCSIKSHNRRNSMPDSKDVVIDAMSIFQSTPQIQRTRRISKSKSSSFDAFE